MVVFPILAIVLCNLEVKTLTVNNENVMMLILESDLQRGKDNICDFIMLQWVPCITMWTTVILCVIFFGLYISHLLI